MLIGFNRSALRFGSAEGPDLIITAPDTVGGSSSWNAGTETLTCTTETNPADWNGVLQTLTLYHMTFNYTCSSGSKLRIYDGANIVYTTPVLGASGTIDVQFTTTSGTNFVIQADSGLFTGTVSSIVVRKVL